MFQIVTVQDKMTKAKNILPSHTKVTREMLAKGTYKNINGDYTNKEVPFGFVFDKHLFLDNQEIKSTISRSPKELALIVNNASQKKLKSCRYQFSTTKDKKRGLMESE